MATVQSTILCPINPIAFWQQVRRCAHGPNCRRCCWPWRSTPAGQYGAVVIAHRRYGAHRLALELDHGAILLPGILACHTCDNPPCCNPRHLYAGTVTDNLRDRSLHGAYVPAVLAGYPAADRAAIQAWLDTSDILIPSLSC